MSALGSVLSGPLTADDYRRALDSMQADGFVLIHRDDLAATAEEGPSDGSEARRLALVALLHIDLDLLAEALVGLLWHDLGATAA